MAIIFFFVSVIILLATIVLLWPKLTQRSYAEAIKHVIDESKLNGRISNARKSDGSSLNIQNIVGSGLDGWNWDEQELNGMNIDDSAAFNLGFSSILLISAMPLLIICLIASTFIAAFRKTECTATSNHAGAAYIDKH